MTREDIIRLADEAGIQIGQVHVLLDLLGMAPRLGDLERFAQLVVAEQQKRIDELEFSWAGCSQQLKDACQDLDEMEGVAARLTTRAMKLEMQLAASQAQIKVLREALSIAMIGGDYLKTEREQLEQVFNQPTDDSALQAAIAAERETCAKVCEDEACGGSAFNSAAQYMAKQIRARKEK